MSYLNDPRFVFNHEMRQIAENKQNKRHIQSLQKYGAVTEGDANSISNQVDVSDKAEKTYVDAVKENLQIQIDENEDNIETEHNKNTSQDTRLNTLENSEETQNTNINSNAQNILLEHNKNSAQDDRLQALENSSADHTSRLTTAETSLNSLAKMSQTITGDGTTTSWTITHNKNTRVILYRVYDMTNWQEVQIDFSLPTVNTATIAFYTAPANNQQYLVVIQ